MYIINSIWEQIGKNGKITSNLWCNSPQGIGRNGSPNPMRPYKLVKYIMGTDIILNLI